MNILRHFWLIEPEGAGRRADPDCDSALLEAGYVTVTPLGDLSTHAQLDRLRRLWDGF